MANNRDPNQNAVPNQAQEQRNNNNRKEEEKKQFERLQSIYQEAVGDKFSRISWEIDGTQKKRPGEDLSVTVGFNKEKLQSGIVKRVGFLPFRFDANDGSIKFFGGIKNANELHNALDFAADQGFGQVILDWDNVKDVNLDMVMEVLLAKSKETPPQGIILGGNVQAALGAALGSKKGAEKYGDMQRLANQLNGAYEQFMEPEKKKAETNQKYEEAAKKMAANDKGPADATQPARDAWVQDTFTQANANTPAEKLHVMDAQVAKVEERSKALDEAKDALNTERASGLVKGAEGSREALVGECEREQARLDAIQSTLNAEMAKPDYQNIVAQAPVPAQQPAGQQPPAQQPAGQQPPAQQPAGQQPAGQQPPAQQPAGQQPPAQQPAGQQPPAQQPAGQQPPAQQPAGQQPPAQQPAGQQPPAQQPAGQQPPAQQPAGQQPPAQQPAGQQPPAQQPAGQQPPAQQPPAQQPAPPAPKPPVDAANIQQRLAALQQAAQARAAELEALRQQTEENRNRNQNRPK